MKDNENKGYIIFNADGTKPNSTLAVISDDDSISVIAEGKRTDFIKALGIIARTLATECDVPMEFLADTVRTAIALGDKWEAVLMGLEFAANLDNSDDVSEDDE